MECGPAIETELGVLFNADCMDVLPGIDDECIDLVFSDPPFNVGKDYGPLVNDSMSEGEYLWWCKQWIDECVRVLKPGGSFFLYNLPKWCMVLGTYISKSLVFRDWIAVDMKLRLPIKGRLYPSHYGLIYFTKGKATTFNNIRVPISTCRHCGCDIKDYGGHRGKINPAGVNLTDVWSDVPPVRHRKHKPKSRKANSLPPKLLQRVLHISTNPGDTVLDPFGGSGTTYEVAERMGRRWVGIEIGEIDSITERLGGGVLCGSANTDVYE